MLAGEIDEERIKDLDFDVGEFFRRLQEKIAALRGREERRRLAHGLVHDPHDDLVEDARGALDDVEVAVGDRVVGARTDRYAVRSAQRHLADSTGDPRIAVPPLLQERQVQLERLSMELSHTTRASGASTGGSMRPSCSPRRGASLYGGSQKTKSQRSPRASGGAQESERVRAHHARALGARGARGSRGSRARRRRPSRRTWRRRAARERLDPERARARIEVEHGAVRRRGPSMLKSASRTRSAVGRVARRAARERLSLVGARATTPHQAVRPRSARSRARRSAARSRRAAARAPGRRARGPRAAARSSPTSRALEQGGVFGQARDPELGKARLLGAEQSPSPAGQVHLGQPEAVALGRDGLQALPGGDIGGIIVIDFIDMEVPSEPGAGDLDVPGMPWPGTRPAPRCSTSPIWAWSR